MTMFNGEEFIYGYPKDELMLFALACREAGITNEKLHDITFDIKRAITVLKAEIEKEVIGSLTSWVDRIAEQTEPSGCWVKGNQGEQICDNCIKSTDCSWK